MRNKEVDSFSGDLIQFTFPEDRLFDPEVRLWSLPPIEDFRAEPNWIPRYIDAWRRSGAEVISSEEGLIVVDFLEPPDNLVVSFDAKVRKAIQNPVDFGEYERFLLHPNHMIMRGREYFDDVPGVVEIPFSKYQNLSEGDKLKMEFILFSHILNDSYAKKPVDSLNQLFWFFPGSCSNMIRHESQHCEAVPSLKHDLWMGFTFHDKERSSDSVDGRPIFSRKLSEEECAFMAVAPFRISFQDCLTAQSIARTTENKELRGRIHRELDKKRDGFDFTPYWEVVDQLNTREGI